MSNPTPDQRQHIANWAAEGATLNQIQDRLRTEFGITLTYMETRLLMLELGVKLQDRPREKPPEEEKKPETPPAPPEGDLQDTEYEQPAASDAPAGSLSVTVDEIRQRVPSSAARPPSVMETRSCGSWTRWAVSACVDLLQAINRRPLTFPPSNPNSTASSPSAASDLFPRLMLLIIDNYDSFTYNLVQYFGEMGAVMEIRRNDQVTLEEIEKLKPDHICISPGPCTPKEAGISCAVIERFGKSIPLLGVCLGHQAIGHVFGGDVVRADRLMHGKTSMINHGGTSVFKGMPEPFEATRYHSLLVKRATLPSCLEITATASDDDSEIMGLRHKECPFTACSFIRSRSSHRTARSC